MRRLYTSRPPASCRSARIAWDMLTEDDPRKPVAMRHAFLTYWVWVMEMTDGGYEEVDALTITRRQRYP
jgi:hypothetical protein